MKKLFSILMAMVTVISTASTVYASGLQVNEYNCEIALGNYYDTSNEEIFELPTESKNKTSVKEQDPTLEAYQSDSGSVWLNFPAVAGAVKYTVYIYDDEKEKYCAYETCENNGTGYYIDEEYVLPETEYKFLLRKFDEDGNILFSGKASVTTRIAAPTLVIKNSGKPKITWTANTDTATGYEMYIRQEDADDYLSYRDYSDSRKEDILKAGFHLYRKSNDKASDTVTFKAGKDYTVLVRSFYIENGEEKYSLFTHGHNTGDPSSYVNALTLKSKIVCSGNELELVKKYVNETITDDMTNYEKMTAIFNLVHKHGEYQTDINKIDGNRPVWQIMEKQEGQCASWAFCLNAMLEYVGFDVKVVRGLRSSGQQHFWCQIKLNGEWYDMDAHLGEYLSSPYIGSYMGYKVVETF